MLAIIAQEIYKHQEYLLIQVFSNDRRYLPNRYPGINFLTLH